MKALLTHVAGVDVHKEKLAITVLIGAADEDPKSYQFESNTFTSDLTESGQKLLQMGVKNVAMESSGIYWKPIHHIWSSLGLKITLGNAFHMRNVPGRKTDMNDSHWIAVLHRSGLIRASYIPEEEFQELRALTRHRHSLVNDISRIKNRVQKVLEDGNIKIGSILNDVFSKAGVAILDAISNGVTDADQLAVQVTTKIKRKGDLKKALTNSLTNYQRFVIKELMLQYRSIQDRVEVVESEIEKKTKKHSELIEKLIEIPGIKETSAQGILAEATTKMEVFVDDRRFAAWAGVAPANRESAGKRKKAGLRQGNPILRRMLIQCANGAIQKKNSYYRAKHNQLRFRLGSYNKATVAIANKIARVIFHIIRRKELRYKDVGISRADPADQQIRRTINKLKNLGVEVSYTDTEKKISISKTS